jgi:PH (Pleckstrin Homology) domain-containing protein
VTPGPDAGLQAPFRPVRGRRTALGFAIAQAVVLVTTALVLPGAGWFDVLGFAAVAAGVGWVLLRFALLRADPRPDALVVQNLINREEVPWARIVSVRFAGGDPWVLLDLSDGDVLAVMAIQRADGAFGAAEARRLATLVAAGTRTTPQD